MKRLLLALILAIVLSLGVITPPSFVKADPSPVYQLIIQDPDEVAGVNSHDLKEIYAAVDETSLYLMGVTYENWIDPQDVLFLIFLDVDQDTSTGGTDARLGYPEGVHGIGADYVAFVGEWLFMWEWNNTRNWWDYETPIDYSSTNMPNNTNTFEIVINLSDIGYPAAIDIVGVGVSFITSWDYAPDVGYVTYPSTDNFVTGGGTIKANSKKKALTFAGTVGYVEGVGPVGQFQIVDHIAKESWHCSNDFDSLYFSGDPIVGSPGPSSSHNTATFTATFVSNRGNEKTVTIRIVDVAESGAGEDIIGYWDPVLKDWIECWTIDGGNFQVHDVEPSAP